MTHKEHIAAIRAMLAREGITVAFEHDKMAAREREIWALIRTAQERRKETAGSHSAWQITNLRY